MVALVRDGGDAEAEAERYREQVGRVVAQMEADSVPLAGPHASSALVDSFVRDRGPSAAPAGRTIHPN
jgi:hypothetical protein